MAKRLSFQQIDQIKKLRSFGFSLPEISKKLNIGQGTVWRHIQGIKILDKYKKVWSEKRKPSIRRKMLAVNSANAKAQRVITNLSIKEKLLVLASLYWAEGAKIDFNLTNSDPALVRVFIQSLKDVLKIPNSRLKLNIRIYEDLDKEKCINFWLQNTGLARSNLSSVNTLSGKKTGKLEYGMCRVRVIKGGDMLKYMVAVRHEIAKKFEDPNY